MTQKKKMTLAIVALVAVLLIAVTSVVLIMAALNATVKSNITISYTAYNVDASVEATYQVSGQEAVTIYTDAEKTDSVLEFATSEASGIEKSFQPTEEIKIEAEDTVVIHYIIKNTDTTGNTDFKVSLNETVNQSENIKYEYCITTDATGELTYVDEWTDVEAVAYNQPLHVFVRVSILEDTQNAKFDGSFSFKLEINR